MTKERFDCHSPKWLRNDEVGTGWITTPSLWQIRNDENGADSTAFRNNNKKRLHVRFLQKLAIIHKGDSIPSYRLCEALQEAEAIHKDANSQNDSGNFIETIKK